MITTVKKKNTEPTHTENLQLKKKNIIYNEKPNIKPICN